MFRRALLAVVVLILLVPALPAAAAGTGCVAVFPDTTWDEMLPAGPVTVYAADVGVGIADRIVGDVSATAESMAGRMGGLDGVEICVFGDRIPIDAAALGWTASRPLRAASLAEERVVVLSSFELRYVEWAGILGLAHQASWGLAGPDYPQPWGYAVGQWFAAQAAGRLERYHATMRFARVVRDLPESLNWAAGETAETLVWDPQYQESPLGDFVDYAVGSEGDAVLADPASVDFDDLHAAWLDALISEARGSDEPTRDWMFGVASIVVVLLSAVLLAWWNGRRTRKPPGPRNVTRPVEAGPEAGPEV